MRIRSFPARLNIANDSATGNLKGRPIVGDRRPPFPLERAQPYHWPATETDLLVLPHVLGKLVLLEEKLAYLLSHICSGSLLTADDLAASGAFAGSKVGGGRHKARMLKQIYCSSARLAKSIK